MFLLAAEVDSDENGSKQGKGEKGVKEKGVKSAKGLKLAIRV